MVPHISNDNDHLFKEPYKVNQFIPNPAYILDQDGRTYTHTIQYEKTNNVFLQENNACQRHEQGKNRYKNQNWRHPPNNWFKWSTDASRLDFTNSTTIRYVWRGSSRKIIKKISVPNRR